MTTPPKIFRLALRLVPDRWRASVERDLLDEAARAGLTGGTQTAWLTTQTIGIAARLAGRALVDRWRARIGLRSAIDSLALDLRQAMRAVTRQPWSAAVIVGTLAVGMSAATAAFAVFNHVLFRPVPGTADADGLVTVYFQPPDRQTTYSNAPREALAALRTVAVVESLGASSDATLTVVSRPGAAAAFVGVEFVTDRYLDLLGVRARVGRMLNDDDLAARRSVAMISERWWRQEFAADPSILGSTIEINRHPVPIVGVVAGYRGWSALRVGTVDIWMPIDTPVGEAAVSADRVFSLVGRLRPDRSPEIFEQQARAAFAPFASSTRKVMSIGTFSPEPAVPAVYRGLHDTSGDRVRNEITGMYPFALGASALLLLLACANTANLLLARTMRRRRDWAVRSAIGASRWRLARGLLIEAAILGALATAAGLALARAFVALVQGEQIFDVGPALDDVGLDRRVLGFAAALGSLTVALFGLVPALAASRSALPRALSESGRTTRQGRRLRTGLVAVQLALALTLLASAGVLLRSLQNLRAADLGMKTDAVVSFDLNPRRLGHRGQRIDAILDDTLDRLRRTPGVESAALASPSPFWRSRVPANLKVRPADEVPGHEVSTAVVSADYFHTLQIPILAGRAFTEAEVQRPPAKHGVGIASASLARQLFGNEPPVGRSVYLSRAATGWELDRTIEIVGVAGDTRSGVDFRGAARPVLYEPAAAIVSAATYFVRSRLTAPEAIAAARTVVREVDPTLPMTDAGALREAVERLIPEDRILALLVGGVALLATLLGLVGVHAVIAQSVAERTREFGIRMALGASRQSVSRDVVGGVAIVAAAGLAAGLALFAAAASVLESRLYGVSPADPAMLGGAIVLLGLAALAAAWAPARRATRVDPVAALRVE